MKEECLICKAPLEYLSEDVEMECELCHKKEVSKTRCVNGHYVCSECHMQGIDRLVGICLEEYCHWFHTFGRGKFCAFS